MSIGSFNKKIENPKTKFEWICNNEEAVNEHMEDKYCGIGFSCSAFSNLFHLVIMMHKQKLYHDVNTEMELLLLRGNDDPCTGVDKGVEDSKRILYNAGFNRIKNIDYPNMRHEILAEKNSEIV